MRNIAITCMLIFASVAISEEQNFRIPQQNGALENQFKIINNSIAIFKIDPWGRFELEDRTFHLIRLTASKTVGISRSRKYMLAINYENRTNTAGKY